MELKNSNKIVIEKKTHQKKRLMETNFAIFDYLSEDQQRKIRLFFSTDFFVDITAISIFFENKKFDSWKRTRSGMIKVIQKCIGRDPIVRKKGFKGIYVCFTILLEYVKTYDFLFF